MGTKAERGPKGTRGYIGKSKTTSRRGVGRPRKSTVKTGKTSKNKVLIRGKDGKFQKKTG